MNYFKNHPFAVEAYFKNSVVLTFAVPKEQLQAMIPSILSLDVYKNKWAFVAVALVKTKGLRPRGFPSFLGNDFDLIGYRIFVRYTDKQGRRLRGLYIIKSETNSKKMEFLGNLLTHYKYTTTDIEFKESEESRQYSSSMSNFNFTIKRVHGDCSLPLSSPFSTFKEARRFAGPLPFTFSYNEQEKAMLIIEGVRQNWIPHPMWVEEYSFAFLKELGLTDYVLANAFELIEVPYYWKKGRIEKWK